jgi:hypothetical protein
MANIYAEHKESGLFYYKEYFIPKEERFCLDKERKKERKKEKFLTDNLFLQNFRSLIYISSNKCPLKN